MRKDVENTEIRNVRSEGLCMKYFVLSPTKNDPYGQASRMAIYEYAKAIKKTNRLLSEDLTNWMHRLP